MKKIVLLILLFCAILIFSWLGSSKQEEGGKVATNNLSRVPSQKLTSVWVSSRRLNRRTCPSTSCGIVGRFFRGQKLNVHERSGGWVRVSKRYYASCVDGKSEYVDKGNSDCTIENGIVDGKLAEWVSETYLLDSRPHNPADSATKAEILIAQSDDFADYRETFLVVARKLIANRRCNERDFMENGGWTSSVNHKNANVYFIYCGGIHRSNRIYLNADTGKIFQ